MSGKARAIESLAGALAGTLGGAGTGGLAYTPDSPLEWMDEDGYVQRRELSADERAARRSLMAHAALVGAGVGTAASLGGGMWRRGILANAELRGAKDLGDSYLNPLRVSLKRTEDIYAGLAGTPAKHTTTTAKTLKRRIDSASGILKREEASVRDLLTTAKKDRAGKPWGGLDWTTRNSENIKGHQVGAHPDLVNKHFESMAKGLGFKEGFTMSNRRAVFEKAITSGMRKQAFDREMLAILEAT